MKDGLVRIVRTSARTYIRYAPWKLGKRTLYTRIVKPWVLWHEGKATAMTSGGVRHRVHLPDEIGSRIYYFGVWEPSVTRVFQNILKRGDTVVDIGANIGYYTLLSSKCVGPIGHVYAIEASPTIYRML